MPEIIEPAQLKLMLAQISHLIRKDIHVRTAVESIIRNGHSNGDFKNVAFGEIPQEAIPY